MTDSSSALSRKGFLKSAALLAAPAVVPAPALAAAAHLETAGVTHPSWTPPLERYDAAKYGPLLAVSDEGDNAPAIAAAAYASPKARALPHATATSIGIMIDGERMVSAGEGPIGPAEYAKVYAAARNKTYCSTNVGVRANTRVYELLPEFSIAAAAQNESAWIASVFAAFAPFVNTPNHVPRPLTVRLVVQPSDTAETVSRLVAKLEAGRASGKLGPASLQSFALLSISDVPIAGGAPVAEIERVFAIAARSGIAETAIDGPLTMWAREHISVASLLNIADVPTLQALFASARNNNVRLVYRYQVDVDSTARTIWTGLYTARAHGFSAGKYGLTPLTLEEQERVVTLVSGWTKGWTTVPAFYVDTPLVTANDVYDASRAFDAAVLWMQRMHAAGAKLALFDCPDRLAGRYLIHDAQHPTGVFTLAQIAALETRAKAIGIKTMWSGGLSARLAYAMGVQRVFAIFCTGAAARAVAVHGDFADDPDLAYEIAPTQSGVQHIQTLLQAGFLATTLAAIDPTLAKTIQAQAQSLLRTLEAKANPAKPQRLLESTLRGAWAR
jgi:hypothetical protein